MKLLILLFSFSAIAAAHRGNFTTQEVEPILVWEHVSGSDEWVRKGSRPLYNLEVEYDISITGEVSNLNPALTGIKEIDKGFTAETMLSTFFARPESQLLVYAQKTELNILTIIESSVGRGKKRMKFQSEWLVIDAEKVNESFRQVIVVNEKELHFDQTLTKLPLAFSICAGQDRRFSHTVKHIGCQDITAEELKAGTVLLKEIDFSQASPNRNLVYFFNWRVLGKWLAGIRGPGPFVIVERK